MREFIERLRNDSETKKSSLLPQRSKGTAPAEMRLRSDGLMISSHPVNTISVWKALFSRYSAQLFPRAWHAQMLFRVCVIEQKQILDTVLFPNSSSVVYCSRKFSTIRAACPLPVCCERHSSSLFLTASAGRSRVSTSSVSSARRSCSPTEKQSRPSTIS